MEEEDELAELRAQRAACTGQVTLSELRQHQAAAVGDRYGAASGSRAGAAGGASDDDDDDDDDGPVVAGIVDEGDPDDPLRHHLPMSFGKQEVQTIKPVEMHEKTKRTGPSIGPPRPPARQQQQQQQQAAVMGPPRPPSMGPPRPPAMGPPRPPRPAAAAADTGAGEQQQQQQQQGPPRPPGSRSGGWMTVADVIGHQPAPAPAPAAADGDGDDEGMAGPPRPPAGADGNGELVGPPRPPAGATGGEDEDMVGPPRPPAGSDDDSSDDGSDGGEADDPSSDPYQLPISHEVSLQGFGRGVTCLDVEHSGNRLVVGSMDNSLRLFDFNGMKADLRSFRELTPSDGHPVLAVSWSPSGDAFLCVTGSAQPRVYDRDGKLRGECVRGDMYIRDMKNTKGHITGCTGGVWHPTDRFTAATCSEDGTVRIWDVHNILQKTVVRPTNPSAARVAVTSCAYNSTGKLLAAGLIDGTIQVWGVGGKFGTSAAVGVVLPPSAQMVEKQGWTYVSRPTQLLRGAHAGAAEITGLSISQDDRLLASRSMDGSLKLWDLRAFKQPLGVFGGLPCNYATTNAIFSPDEVLLLTGTATRPEDAAGGGGGGGGGGAVVFVDVRELREVRRVGMPSPVSALAWHSRLNQIFAGVGDKRGGATRVLYDTTFSERGVLAAVGRAPRQANPFDSGLPLLIKTPHALPMFREDPGRKRSREKARLDPVKSRKPDPGATAGVGRAGRIGSTGGTLLTQHLLKTRGKLVSVDAEMDPREALLRHADKTDDAISRLTAAYAKTQPTPVFAEPEPDEDEDE